MSATLDDFIGEDTAQSDDKHEPDPSDEAQIPPEDEITPPNIRGVTWRWGPDQLTDTFGVLHGCSTDSEDFSGDTLHPPGIGYVVSTATPRELKEITCDTSLLPPSSLTDAGSLNTVYHEVSAGRNRRGPYAYGYSPTLQRELVKTLVPDNKQYRPADLSLWYNDEFGLFASYHGTTLVCAPEGLSEPADTTPVTTTTVEDTSVEDETHEDTLTGLAQVIGGLRDAFGIQTDRVTRVENDLQLHTDRYEEPLVVTAYDLSDIEAAETDPEALVGEQTIPKHRGCPELTYSVAPDTLERPIDIPDHDARNGEPRFNVGYKINVDRQTTRDTDPPTWVEATVRYAHVSWYVSTRGSRPELNIRTTNPFKLEVASVSFNDPHPVTDPSSLSTIKYPGMG
ncbi:hypothetical protein RYH80_18190 [Halobaculum sp. MBLA0147]|uniref:hypothetical protein n=1 Tax=Halobaculum sp. MBLA0147 TaxID=3079934 RepID=UPI003524DFE7